MVSGNGKNRDAMAEVLERLRSIGDAQQQMFSVQQQMLSIALDQQRDVAELKRDVAELKREMRAMRVSIENLDERVKYLERAR